MKTLNYYIMDYLEYCEYRKRLDAKTLKAYRIDSNPYRPKSVKRKISSLKVYLRKKGMAH